MSHPTLVTDDLVELISRHQIIDAEPLWQFLAARGGAAALPHDAADVTADLVRDRLLTEFQADHLLAGSAAELVVGRYLLLDRLGDLGSNVFLARPRRASSPAVTPARAAAPVVLKLLSRDQDIPASVVERFRREAEALARLDHPGIVGIKDSGEDAGRLFLVTEYIDGQSLAERVRHQGPMPPALAARIVHGALEALDHVHAAGLVHRSLEPGHLMVDRDERVRIVDLGVARFLDDPASSLTMFGGGSQFLGSVEYQSPEQLRNSHDVDIRTDVYALGAIFYFLLTGKAPFSQHALLRIAAGVITHPQPLGQLRPDLPREVIGVVERMMACDPDARFATPREAIHGLDGWLNQVSPVPLRVARRPSAQGTMPAAAPEPEPTSVRPNLPVVALAVVVFVATLGLTLGLMQLVH